MADRVQVFTFKTGLLSRVAHDLRLRVERFEVRREADEIIAEFEADSIRVDGVMTKGRLDASALGPRDRAKIVSTIQAEVLATRRHPKIRYRGRLDGLSVDGVLELAGVERPLRVVGRLAGGQVHASVEIQPSRHRIQPYRALGGAIKLQDRVRVTLELDAARLGLAEPGTPPGP